MCTGYWRSPRRAAIAAINFAFDNGADYYVLAEPTAGPALIRANFFEKFVLPVLKEVVTRSKGPVVLHVCGNTDSIIDLMCDTGVVGSASKKRPI